MCTGVLFGAPAASRLPAGFEMCMLAGLIGRAGRLPALQGVGDSVLIDCHPVHIERVPREVTLRPTQVAINENAGPNALYKRRH